MITRVFRTLLLPAVTVMALASCDRTEAPAEPPGPHIGYWHADITLPGGDIETGLEISRAGENYQASIINGQERVAIEEVSFTNGELLLRFPAFNNEIRATLIDGDLQGELILVKRFGEEQRMPFRATPGAQRHDAQPAANIDLSGRWQASFIEPDGSETPSIGEFAQRGSRLFGTFLNSSGDYRYLAGYVSGKEFKLSTFDGAHAFLFSGRVEDEEIVDATFWSGTAWEQSWSAKRNEDVELPDAYSLTYLKPGYDRFSFEFLDHDGSPVALTDEKFTDKVVVVMLAGTWCPNCQDEARFMAPLYEEYREQGLEVIALMYEHFEDYDIASKQVAAFREKFDIAYDTLIAGTSDKSEAAATLPALNAVLAFPTTIFIDRGGRVRSIHTGFSGPGTGEHFEKLQEEFRVLIAELLEEPADIIDSLATEESEETEDSET